jgi:hypothetical protein
MSGTLGGFAREIADRASINIVGGEVLAKILTDNDDSGRHGVLIPVESYGFFPELPIANVAVNATTEFTSFDAARGEWRGLAWKYYERYPERRVTRLNSKLNNRDAGRRLIVFLHVRDNAGRSFYLDDACVEGVDARFPGVLQMLFGKVVKADPGAFVRLPLDFTELVVDQPLEQLLSAFDRVRELDWVESQRQGDTGVGFTFESLLGIKENNDRRADFMGIELKCKLARNASIASGKINLFQQGPEWVNRMPMTRRLRVLGQRRPDGRYACFSQVTSQPNNLGLQLLPVTAENRIDLLKNFQLVGRWTIPILEKRLTEKHARAAFIKADARRSETSTQYRYRELIYCERPSIRRFVDMIGTNEVVFEFTMSEKPGGGIRNHGYPWRLASEDLLDHLFAVQVRLRG